MLQNTQIAHNPPPPRLFYLDLSKVPVSPATGALDFSRFDFFGGSEALPILKLVDDFEASYDYVRSVFLCFFNAFVCVFVVASTGGSMCRLCVELFDPL